MLGCRQDGATFWQEVGRAGAVCFRAALPRKGARAVPPPKLPDMGAEFGIVSGILNAGIAEL